MHARPTLLLCTVTCFAVSSLAQVVDITLIADTNTPVPFGSGNFYGWGATNIAVDSAGRVAFTSALDEGGVSTAAKEGVYLYDAGTLSRIADLNMAAPGQGGANYSRFAYLDIDQGQVVFGAQVVGSSAQDLFRYSAGATSLYFSAASPGPAGTIMTTGGQSPAMSGGTTVFSSAYYNPDTTAFGYGYFSFDGTSTTPVATSLDTVIGAGGSKPNGFSAQTVAQANGTVGLWANLSGGTVTGGAILGYRDGLGLNLIANAATSVPGESAVFDRGVSFAGVMGQQVVFSGGWTGGEGIFAANADGSSLQKLMDLNSVVPGTSTPFEDISWVVVGDDHLMFQGAIGGGEYGLYSMTDGVIHTLLDTTMSLGGNEISSLSTEGIHGVGGDYVAFRVGFESGLEGLYRFQLASASAVPEPSTYAVLLGMLALGCAMHGRRRRRLVGGK